MNDTKQPPAQIDIENLSQNNKDLTNFINQTLLNPNLNMGGNAHHTIVQNVRVPDVSQMIQTLNLQNPEFIKILKNNSTIPAPGTEGEDKTPKSKSTGDDDTTVPDEVQSSLSQRVIFHALAKMFKNNTSTSLN